MSDRYNTDVSEILETIRKLGVAPCGSHKIGTEKSPSDHRFPPKFNCVAWVLGVWGVCFLGMSVASNFGRENVHAIAIFASAWVCCKLIAAGATDRLEK